MTTEKEIPYKEQCIQRLSTEFSINLSEKQKAKHWKWIEAKLKRTIKAKENESNNSNGIADQEEPAKEKPKDEGAETTKEAKPDESVKAEDIIEPEPDPPEEEERIDIKADLVEFATRLQAMSNRMKREGRVNHEIKYRHAAKKLLALEKIFH